MDMVLGIGSLVRDVIDADADLTKFVQRLRVLQFRVDRLFEETQFQQCEALEKNMYKMTLENSKTLIKQTQQRLKNMGIADKISINLPFNKTKQNLKQAIQDLQKASVELKEKQIVGKQMKRSLQNKFSIKVEQSKKQKRFQEERKQKQIKFDPTLVQDPLSPKMLATLQQDAGDIQGNWVQITIEIDGPQALMKLIKDKKAFDLEKTVNRFKVQKGMKNQQVLSFDRKFFKPVYEPARKIMKQIDFISSKQPQFQLTFQQISKQKSDTLKVQQILINTAKQCLSQKKQNQSSPKNTQLQQFLSFPDKFYDYFSTIDISQQCKLVLTNFSKDGTYIKRLKSQKWELINEQTYLYHGDEICPIMKKPQKILPAFTFKVSLETLSL